MKKVFKSALVIALGSLLALSSCKEADEATPIASLGSGTVTGQVFYDIDEVNDTDKDGDQIAENIDTDIPTGAIIRYAYTDEVTGEAVTGTTTVNNSGSYSFSVPADQDGVSVSITADDFKGSLKFEYADPEEFGEFLETTEDGFFSETTISTETVKPGKVNIVANKFLATFTSTANPSNR